MGQVLHGSARTTEATRRDIQNSQESLDVLARRYNVNRKTIAKWRSRKDEGVHDRKAKGAQSVLSELDEKVICEFRQKTRLPLDDCLDCLKELIPALTRSNLHRCLQRNGLSRLPRESDEAAPGKKFKDYPIGFVHVDIAEIRISKQKYHLFVGICRVSKFCYAEIFDVATTDKALEFLDHLVEACPFHIHTILTDNGSQFTYIRSILKRGKGPSRRHRFDLACKNHGIRHKTTKPYHPQTNGQVERMNRTIKEATVKAYHYDDVEQLKAHLQSWILAYNCAKKLTAIKRNTPFEEINKWWKQNPKLFRINPNHLSMGLNN